MRKILILTNMKTDEDVREIDSIMSSFLAAYEINLYNHSLTIDNAGNDQLAAIRRGKWLYRNVNYSLE